MTRWWVACAAGLMLVANARAQDLPAQIRIVVPLVAGSSLDGRGRVIADALGKRLGRRVIVENRPGAGGTLGAVHVAKSKPDGATLMMTNNSHSISTHVYPNPGYDPIRDFAPVAQAYSTGMVILAHPSVKATSVKELVALARQQSLSYGSSGTGSLPHLAMEMFLDAAGVKMMHVPYRGDAQAITDLIGGRIALMVSGYPAAIPQVKAGKLRAIAVMERKRASVMPDVPGLAESYPGFELDTWAGFFAPAGTPPAVVERLNKEILAAIATPAVRQNYEATSAAPSNRSPAQFAAFVKQEWERYGKVVRALGLKPE